MSYSHGKPFITVLYYPHVDEFVPGNILLMSQVFQAVTAIFHISAVSSTIK